MKFTNNFRLLVSLKLEVFVAHLVIVFVIFTVMHLFPWGFHQICQERAAHFRDDISYVFSPWSLFQNQSQFQLSFVPTQKLKQSCTDNAFDNESIYNLTDIFRHESHLGK